jgi:hypothetical protein
MNFLSENPALAILQERYRIEAYLYASVDYAPVNNASYLSHRDV